MDAPQPDLIFLSNHLPDRTGHEIIKELTTRSLDFESYSSGLVFRTRPERIQKCDFPR